MSMLIRSQDKNKLVNFDNCSVLYIANSGNIMIETVEDVYTLGVYNDVGKAYKVLDDIQDSLLKYCRDGQHTVYIMPAKDDKWFEED